MIMSFILYKGGHYLPQVRPNLRGEKDYFAGFGRILIRKLDVKVKFGEISIKQK